MDEEEIRDRRKKLLDDAIRHHKEMEAKIERHIEEQTRHKLRLVVFFMMLVIGVAAILLIRSCAG